MADSIVFLSVVVPVFNEANRIHNLREIIHFLSRQDFSSEMIVVDDGSTDNTLEKLHDIRGDYLFEIISYPENKGKGYAIKMGMLRARGKFRLFLDIDLSTPIDEMEKFIPFLVDHDIVIGTRKNAAANLIKRQPIIRETLGKGFTLLSKLFLRVNISDFTCGFKCFSRRAAEAIFPRLTINRWGFDAEILFLSQKYYFRVKEVSVRWKNDRQTKVRIPLDIIRSLADLVTIRLNNIKGKYN